MMNNQEEMLQRYLAAKSMGGSTTEYQAAQGPNTQQPAPKMNKRGDRPAQSGGQQVKPQKQGVDNMGPIQGGSMDMNQGEVPTTIRNFLEDLSNTIMERRTDTFEDMYLNEYSKLSDQLVKAQMQGQGNRHRNNKQDIMGGSLSTTGRWPSLQEASQFLGSETGLHGVPDSSNQSHAIHSVHLIYKELYYRHIHSRFSEKNILSIDRQESYNNYEVIFDQLCKDMMILNGNSNDGREPALLTALPISYCWDLLDEYLFQCLIFSQFRAKTISRKGKSIVQVQQGNAQYEQLKQQTAAAATEAGQDVQAALNALPPPQNQVDPTLEQDYNLLKENPQTFHTQEVHNILKQLISASGIDSYLLEKKNPGSSGKSKPGPQNEQAMFIGYFAYIQLIRYHLMLGEYDIALRTTDLLDLEHDDALYYRSPSAHIHLIYYLAFSLFMSKRYSDCANVCGHILFFIMKIQRFPPIASLYESQGKTHERICRLLVLCHVFAPDNFFSTPDEQLLSMLQDRYSDDINILKTFGQQQVSNNKTTDVNGIIIEKSKTSEKKDTDSAAASESVTLYATKLMEWFNFICPKFLSVLPSNITKNLQNLQQVILSGEDTSILQFSQMDNHNFQWTQFWQSCEAIKVVPKVRSFLRMYTRLSLLKLGKLADCKGSTNEEIENEARALLETVRKSQNQLVIEEVSVRSASGGTVSSGKKNLTVKQILPGIPKRCSDVDFVIDGKDVIVKILKSKTEVQDVYLKEILRLEDICEKLALGA